MESEIYIEKEIILERPIYDKMIKSIIHDPETVKNLFYLDRRLNAKIAYEFFSNVKNVYINTKGIEPHQRPTMCCSSEVECIGEFRGLCLEDYFENNSSAIIPVKEKVLETLKRRGTKMKKGFYEMHDGLYFAMNINLSLRLLYHEKYGPAVLS